MSFPGTDEPATPEQATPGSPTPGSPEPGVLGPVAAKGPKLWGVEPDWSKIPASALGRLRKESDGPAWGVSKTDARQIASEQPEDAQPSWGLPGFAPDPGATEEELPEEDLPEQPVAAVAEEPVGAPGTEPQVEQIPEPTTEPIMAPTPEPVPHQEPIAVPEQASMQPQDAYQDSDQYAQSYFPDEPYPDEEFPPEEDPFAQEYYEPAPSRAPRQCAALRDTAPAAPMGGQALNLTIDESTLKERAQAALEQLVGRPNAKLRDDQWTAIEALVAGRRRALVVQRTGWGKSAVYFVATSLLRAAGAGPTVIISPLLALMRDQISAAERAGIRAVTINSSNVTQWDRIHDSIAAGEVDVLLCSPERLNNPGFRDEVLPRLAHSAGLVVIDEAHCISDWGHDFRPDYRRIRTLLTDLPADIPVLATTATANERVTADIAEQLDTAHTKDVLVLRGNLDRESLSLAVVKLADQPQRVAWLAKALHTIKGSGIIYCLTVSAVAEVTEQLAAAGHQVAAYTGQTDTTEREMLEAQLKNNEVKALVATSALGMGFDKPDLGFVFHLGAPSSPIAYYQQVGRAGRAVDKATVVLLPGSEDQRIWDYFGSLAFPDQAQVEATLTALADAQDAGRPALSVGALETRVDLKRSRLELMLKVLDVDGAVKRVAGGWTATGQPWTYDAERYARVAAARDREQQAMLTYIDLKTCRMSFLRAQLDDPDLPPGDQVRCGRCDNCGGITVPTAPDQASVAAARAAMNRPGLELSPRKMWPSGMADLSISLSGKIPPAAQAQTGRVIARLDGLGWSAPLRELFAASTPDGPTPAALAKAAATVLAAWPAIAQVEGIVAIESATRPQLSQDLAQGLSRYLNKPFIGTLGPVGGLEPGRHDINSAMRLAAVHRRLESHLSGPATAGLPGRTVLLVDDYVDSGWTMTVGARLLHELGATAVFPFALAQF